MTRLARRLVLFLLLGAIGNVTVAWCIGALLNPRMPDAYEQTGSGPGGWGGVEGGDYWGWIVFKHSTPHAVRIISRWNDKGTGGGGSGGWPDDPAAPLIPKWAPQLSPENRAPCGSYHYTIAWEYGWPTRSVGGFAEAIPDISSSGQWNMTVVWSYAIPIEPHLLGDPNTHWDAKLLVFRPLWPGFVINTAFYAAILWLLFSFPFTIRRRRRNNRGLCPACAYPIGESAVCTECGRVLPRV